MPIASTAPLLVVLLVETAGGGWTPGIGDPSFTGWLTVFAYFWGAYLCSQAFRRVSARRPDEKRLASVWFLMCAGLAFLGVNKQLDLQSLVTVVGRRMAMTGGWYERRHVYQVWFVRGMVLAALAGASMITWVLRRNLKDLWLAAVGGTFLVAFVVIRAASFHHVDYALRGTYFGVTLNGILELSGIACVALAAARAGKRRAA